MAAINHRSSRKKPRRRERLAHLEPLERPERPERLEPLEHLRQPQNINRRGISGYILAKRIYPLSINEAVDYKINVIEPQIDSSDSQLLFYEQVPDQDAEGLVCLTFKSMSLMDFPSLDPGVLVDTSTGNG